MFERRDDKLLPFHRFSKRMAVYGSVSGSIVLLSLGVGMLGYHLFAGLSWIDSFLNASMILTGMGPVDQMTGTGAKVFAGIYALFSGVIFLSASAVFLSPVVHRALHSFHLDLDEEDDDAATKKPKPRPRAKRK
ncbi:MAG: hypothetical protein IT366_17215 [Candidatus Hydrogenedentes bacterium]|nr:hypothetical protein [Candidatus Hydrogenedentota bacterium]